MCVIFAGALVFNYLSSQVNSYVILQVVLMHLQDFLGPRFFIPAKVRDIIKFVFSAPVFASKIRLPPRSVASFTKRF